MPTLAAPDGTTLAYHQLGDGTPLVCLPGGMQDSDYLGDLGGLSEHARLVLFDPRGTGQSATPADQETYRCDRQVEDVEALRERLGLARMTLLAHSGGTNLALLYAARYPARVGALVLVCPSAYAAGLTVTPDDRRGAMRLRADEPWYEQASAAFERIVAGQATDADWAAIAPFTYGRWDAETQAHHAAGEQRRNTEAMAVYGSAGAFHPESTRAAAASLDVPVLLLAGEVDTNSPPRVVTELAGLFPNATLATLPGGGHYPWLDDPAWFTTTVAAFLGAGGTRQ
jgi:proline iminopeptidase